MSAIRKGLLQLFFSGFAMRRWNDKLRPVELFEIDKQAHKMIVAFLLTHINSTSLSASKRLELQEKVVERGIFDYLYRLIITDIKPPVFYKIRENASHFEELTTWVLSQLKPVVEPLDPSPGGFWERLVAYHRHFVHNELADRILLAAHLYASEWEFSLIRPFNLHDEETDCIARSFREQLDKLRDVRGLDALRCTSQKTALGRLAAICAQLRFQIRWSETPRIPETSVLGHVFLVALYAYCLSLAVGACRARRLNNFYAGLLHDLPELLTRDIISPVKGAVRQLPGLIKEYEMQEMQSRILSPLCADGYTNIEARLRYFLGLTGGDIDSEFNETIRRDGRIIRMNDFNDLHENGNHDDLDPKEGQLIKTCDSLAAFMEAHTSIRCGIASTGLQEAVFQLKTRLRNQSFGSVSIDTLMADFE